MATTPHLGIPYPIGTDRVSDGDNAIQAVAVQLDGTSWVLPALGSGWTTGAPMTGDVRHRKDGAGNVHIQGALGFSGGSPGVPGFTLPAGSRPPVMVTGACGDAASATSVLVWSVQPTGAVNVASPGGATVVAAVLDIVFSTVPRT